VFFYLKEQIMPNTKNKNIVEDLKEKLSRSKAVTIADYTGVSATSLNDLRQKIRSADAEIVVAKNTLLKVALKGSGQNTEQLESDLKGKNVAVFSFSDIVLPLKSLVAAAKEMGSFKIKSALIEGTYTSADQIDILSQLPSREQMIGQIVGLLSSPISGFVRTLGGVQSKFVRTLAAVADKRK